MDGKLYWKTKTSRKTVIGKEAGYIDTSGYCVITILGKKYGRNRLVWYYHNGNWPQKMIDHIDADTTNDKIENLREATNQQNQFNRRSNKVATSKYKGVHWSNKLNKWVAKYTFNNRQFHIGVFQDELEAARAYDNAVKQHQSFFRKDIFNG